MLTIDASKRTWADNKQWKAALAELADANKLKYDEANDVVVFQNDSSDDE